MNIKRIIVEVDDTEQTFQEFTSVSDFQASQIYLDSTNSVAPKVSDAEVVADPAPVVAPTE